MEIRACPEREKMKGLVGQTSGNHIVGRGIWGKSGGN
jgi:hypothetical protein